VIGSQIKKDFHPFSIKLPSIKVIFQTDQEYFVQLANIRIVRARAIANKQATSAKDHWQTSLEIYKLTEF